MRSVLLAAFVVLLAAPPLRASSPFQRACIASDLIVEARVTGEPDEFGLSLVTPGRAARRPGPLDATLLVRLPERARATGSSWLLFLVGDEMAASLGAWAPVDRDFGILPLGGSAGSPDDLLEAAGLALDPPPDPAALGPRLTALVGRGEAPTSFALGALLDRPELARGEAARLAPVIRSLLASRRVTPQAAALAVSVLAALGRRGDDAVLVDLVASEAPPVVVEAVASALRGIATAATAEHIEHALGGATEPAVPGLLRLAGPARARTLLPLLHEKLGSSRQAVRLAALSSVAELRDASSLHALRAAAASPDEATARAARETLVAIEAAAAAGDAR